MARLLLRGGHRDALRTGAIETQHPEMHARLVEAEMAADLRAYTNGIRGVTNYVSLTFSLFNTAKARRPKTLLTRKGPRWHCVCCTANSPSETDRQKIALAKTVFVPACPLKFWRAVLWVSEGGKYLARAWQLWGH